MATSTKTAKSNKTNPKTNKSLSKKEQDSKSTGKYFRGVRSEFKKVIWPTKQQVAKYSGVVIVVSIVVALAIYLLDYIFRGILGIIVGA